MAVTAASFRARFPQFENIDDARITIFIEEAATELNQAEWGDHFDRAHRLMAAHLMVYEDESGGGDIVRRSRQLSSQGIGDASEAYKNPDDPLRETAFGREFLRLRTTVLSIVEHV